MIDFFEKEIFLEKDIVSLVPFSLHYKESLKDIYFSMIPFGLIWACLLKVKKT